MYPLAIASSWSHRWVGAPRLPVLRPDGIPLRRRQHRHPRRHGRGAVHRVPECAVSQREDQQEERARAGGVHVAVRAAVGAAAPAGVGAVRAGALRDVLHAGLGRPGAARPLLRLRRVLPGLGPPRRRHHRLLLRPGAEAAAGLQVRQQQRPHPQRRPDPAQTGAHRGAGERGVRRQLDAVLGGEPVVGVPPRRRPPRRGGAAALPLRQVVHRLQPAGVLPVQQHLPDRGAQPVVGVPAGRRAGGPGRRVRRRRPPPPLRHAHRGVARATRTGAPPAPLRRHRGEQSGLFQPGAGRHRPVGTPPGRTRKQETVTSLTDRPGP
ncbi:hypothetical protein ANANG_G00114290, partial [Anguilla anguilla]